MNLTYSFALHKNNKHISLTLIHPKNKLTGIYASLLDNKDMHFSSYMADYNVLPENHIVEMTWMKLSMLMSYISHSSRYVKNDIIIVLSLCRMNNL